MWRYEDLKTLTGMSMLEALSRLQAALPDEAYKRVEGAGVELTDIDPAYLTETATAVFGMCGLGWWFVHKGIAVRSEERVSRGGKGYTVYVAIIDHFELYIRLINSADGEEVITEPVYSTGGVDMQDEGYAMRGALTNALGAAFAKLTWQIRVYMGMVRPGRVSPAPARARSEAQTARVGPAPVRPAAAAPQPASPKPESAPVVDGNGSTGENDRPAGYPKTERALATWLHERKFIDGKRINETLGGKSIQAYVAKLSLEIPKEEAITKTARLIEEAFREGGQAA